MLAFRLGKEGLDRFLPRGESTVASTGLALAVLFMVAIGGSVWWNDRAHTRRLETARIDDLKSVAFLLQHSTEALLASDDLSAARRVLVALARQGGLDMATVRLQDGRIFAATDPAAITAAVPPKQWPTGPAPAMTETHVDDRLQMTLPLSVAGHGTASLVIEASTAVEDMPAWPASAGTATIAMGSLMGLLLVYRHARTRLRAMGEIHEGLRAIDHGETALEVLRISDRLGPEAQAWNHLIDEARTLREQEVAEQAHRTLGTELRPDRTLSAACDAMPQGLVLIDANMGITYANGASAVFLESPHEQMVGAAASDHLKSEEVLNLVAGVTGEGARRRGTVEIDRRQDDGTVTGVLRFTVRAVGSGAGVAPLVIIDDITQQRTAEDARHAFVAQAAHELRNPLTNIRLSAETVIDAPGNDTTTRSKYLNVVNQEVRRLERVVSEMLSVAEIESGVMRLADDDLPLATMFEELCHDTQPQANAKGTSVHFDMPPKFPKLTGDRDKLMVALHNLVSNALKYTPDGKQVAVTVNVENDHLYVHVRDNGIGISKEDQQRIFEKFYRATDQRVGEITGSGLGLALAREVVHRHGGDITVESKLDQGSTFTLSLPVPKQSG